ncbi:MAG: hypothetical protein ACRENK_10060 [Gemmatimonadaceae bacterium]
MSMVKVRALLTIGALLYGSLANAQEMAQNVTAPVPGQILTAKRIFISNAGSETYGSESYFNLTRYDGGPNRFYNQLYSAMKSWGRYELTDSPATADVVYEVRFSNPIVDKLTHGNVDGVTNTDFVYDPQLTLTIVDPQTRVALWSLTEHIQPGRDRNADNRNFDSAVDRIVDRAKILVGESISVARQVSLANAAPVGAIEFQRREQRIRHAAIGSGLGLLAGGVIVAREAQICPVASGAECGRQRALTALSYLVSGAVSGALIGWFWPSN